MKSEHIIQNEIRMALGNHDCFVFRANVGKVQMKDGRWFDTGLPIGFPDLFGFKKSNGKIFFIEVKNEKGKLREVQRKFAECVLGQTNTIYGVARSVDDALLIVDNELKGYGY